MSEPKAKPDLAPLPETPVVSYATDGCVMGYCQDVMIIVWGVGVTAALIDEYKKSMAHVASTHQQFSIIHIAPTARPLPSGELRAALATINDDYVGRLLYTAVLLASGGFWASAVRSLITSVQVIARRKIEVKICVSIDEVVKWLAPEHSAQTGNWGDPLQLRAAIEWMLDQPSVQEYRAALS